MSTVGGCVLIGVDLVLFGAWFAVDYLERKMDRDEGERDAHS